jgi:hypothetical protein
MLATKKKRTGVHIKTNVNIAPVRWVRDRVRVRTRIRVKAGIKVNG